MMTSMARNRLERVTWAFATPGRATVSTHSNRPSLERGSHSRLATMTHTSFSMSTRKERCSALLAMAWPNARRWEDLHHRPDIADLHRFLEGRGLLPGAGLNLSASEGRPVTSSSPLMRLSRSASTSVSMRPRLAMWRCRGLPVLRLAIRLGDLLSCVFRARLFKPGSKQGSTDEVGRTARKRSASRLSATTRSRRAVRQYTWYRIELVQHRAACGPSAASPC